MAFLGRPLTFLLQLRRRFIEVLELKEEEVIFPEDSELYIVWGVALAAKDNTCINYQMILSKLKAMQNIEVEETKGLEPLFESEKEYFKLTQRHAKNLLNIQFKVSTRKIFIVSLRISKIYHEWIKINLK